MSQGQSSSMSSHNQVISIRLKVDRNQPAPAAVVSNRTLYKRAPDSSHALQDRQRKRAVVQRM